MAGIDKQRWARLSPLLDELLEADEPARAERLAELRAADAATADELVALLARQSAVETADFLEGVALALPPDATLAGMAVGSYTLERPVGQGGMGSVWLARRSDGRYEGQAAIKFLNLALLGHGGAERFRREGSVLARLEHPHVARLIDAGVVAGSQPYLVLEYVDGEPIDRWCVARKLDVEARLRLFCDVLGAVAHAHSKLVLHRDLKPSNILVTTAGQVKLLDFGIARLMETEESRTALTRHVGNPFTPEYAAPEQIQGAELSTAADVYALGVILFELLTGKRPRVTDPDRGVRRPRSAPRQQSRGRAGVEGAAARRPRCDPQPRAQVPPGGALRDGRRTARRHPAPPRRRAGARAARQPDLPARQVRAPPSRCGGDG